MENVEPNQTKPEPQATPKMDPQAEFTRLYESELPRVYRYICYYVSSHQDAEEVTAETFQRGLRRWSQLSSAPALPRAWLFAIAAQCLVDYARRGWSRPAASLEARFDLPGARQGAGEAVVPKEAVTTLLARLHRLSERDRTALILHFAGGLNYHEIAAVLGVDDGDSALALLQALRRLRELYQADPPPDGVGHQDRPNGTPTLQAGRETGQGGK